MPTGPYTKTAVTYWPNGNKRTEKWQWSLRLAPSDRPPSRVLPGKPPLRYEQHYTESKTDGTDCNNIRAGFWAIDGVPVEWRVFANDVHNRCYEKFVAKTRAAAAQIGADLAERRQSVDMMTRRLEQLYNAALALKQRRWRDFFRFLELPFQVIRLKSFKTLADIWLEYHFGWEPLLEDIFNSIMVLQSPVPSLIKVKVRAQAQPPRMDLSSELNEWGCTEFGYAILREQMGARVRVSNPNLWKANSLGLTNPVSVAWEFAKFSFVVDWFIPVSQFINSWDDLVGLEVVEPYTTLTRFYKSEYRAYTKPENETLTQFNGIGMSFVRETSIEGPILQIRPWKQPGMARAATVISLLIQQMDGLASDLANRWRYV